jgi:hypothetical protein
MNLAAVPTGWKIYFLACVWSGLGIGIVNESAFVTFILWAAGASVGWLIAPTVRDRGWYIGTRFIRYVAAIGLVLFASVLGWMALEPSEHRENQIAVALISGLAAAMLWNHRAVFRFWKRTEDVFNTPIGGKR